MGESPCGFESRLAHQLESQKMGYIHLGAEWLERGNNRWR